MPDKQITVEYFAILQDQAGVDAEQVTTQADDAESLFAELSERHRFVLATDSVRVAINDTLSAWASAIQDGDRITLLPPIAGG